MPTVESLRQELHEAEERLLSELRDMRRGLRKGGTAERPSDSLTMGQKIADQVAATMGSWPFIIIQTGILFVWIILNVTAWRTAWARRPSTDHAGQDGARPGHISVSDETAAA